MRHLNLPSREGEGGHISGDQSRLDGRMEARERRIWDFVQRSPLESLWDLKGVPVSVIAKRTWKALIEDRVFGHAAELGFYFLFALFPTLLCASSVVGLVARSALHFYDRLLSYLAILVPTQALGTVLNTFHQTAEAASSDKVTFGLIAALWSASVGISAIQDTLNAVYKIEDSRSYFVARLEAIGLTIALVVVVTLGLASLLGGSYFATLASFRIHEFLVREAAVAAIHIVSWTIASALLALTFAVLYYWAPDVKKRCWRWLTPGGAIGIVGWLLASLGFRIYLHFFNTYSVTYGSLGAVIILLMWFYITGLMLLLGAEINSEIEAAAAAKRLQVGLPD